VANLLSIGEISGNDQCDANWTPMVAGDASIHIMAKPLAQLAGIV